MLKVENEQEQEQEEELHLHPPLMINDYDPHRHLLEDTPILVQTPSSTTPSSVVSNNTNSNSSNGSRGGIGIKIVHRSSCSSSSSSSSIMDDPYGAMIDPNHTLDCNHNDRSMHEMMEARSALMYRRIVDLHQQQQKQQQQRRQESRSVHNGSSNCSKKTMGRRIRNRTHSCPSGSLNPSIPIFHHPSPTIRNHRRSTPLGQSQQQQQHQLHFDPRLLSPRESPVSRPKAQPPSSSSHRVSLPLPTSFYPPSAAVVVAAAAAGVASTLNSSSSSSFFLSLYDDDDDDTRRWKDQEEEEEESESIIIRNHRSLLDQDENLSHRIHLHHEGMFDLDL